MEDRTGLKESLATEVLRPRDDGLGVEERCSVQGLIELEIQRHDGRIEKMAFSNTIQAELLNAVANAMSDGTMTAVNSMDFYYSGSWDHEQATTIDGGGSGAEAWTRWKAELTATETITVTPVRLGVESGGTWQTTYSEVAITAVTLSSGDSLIVKWTITASVS